MGEFNVDKSTGNLKLTAGADNYTTISYANWLTLTDEQKENGRWDVVGVPANEGYTEADKCMMSDGTTSVEDALDEKPKVLTTEVSFVVNASTNLLISRLLNIPYAKVISLTQAYNDDTYNILAIDHVTGHRISLASNNGMGEVVLLGPDGGWSNLSRQWTILVKVAYLE